MYMYILQLVESIMTFVVPGMYEPLKMKFEADRLDEDPSDEWSEPSLAQMVDKAIDILARGPDGYILFAEGMFWTRTKPWVRV